MEETGDEISLEKPSSSVSPISSFGEKVLPSNLRLSKENFRTLKSITKIEKNRKLVPDTPMTTKADCGLGYHC